MKRGLIVLVILIFILMFSSRLTEAYKELVPPAKEGRCLQVNIELFPGVNMPVRLKIIHNDIWNRKSDIEATYPFGIKEKEVTGSFKDIREMNPIEVSCE